jgi:outer membrane protein TolC
MRMTTVLGGVTAGLMLSIAVTLAQHPARPAADTPKPDAAAHKQWMADAGDVQEDLREALAANSSEKSAAAATRLENILAQTERYWAAKRADDVVQIARRSKALARQVSASAKARKFEQARDAFTRLSSACNACHDLHPEKR